MWFIFTSNLIREELLSMLDIGDSCTLRANHDHCILEDFLKLFGNTTWFNLSEPYIITVLKGTETEQNKMLFILVIVEY